MTTNQEGKHEAVRAITGTARSYNEDWHALFDDDGIAAGPFDSRMLAWINATLGTSYTNVNEAMQAFAVEQGFANWASMNTFENGPPEWVQLAGEVAPVLDLDFKNNRAYFDGDETTPAALLTVTRSTTNGTYINSAGLLTTVGANTLRIGDMGLTVEPAATNVVLWNRDLTNAAWTKTNATAAKDQTGIDGVSNAASSLTATAGNATCLQAITLASSARWQSAFVKRLTGSGAVEMTTDNGTTWTAVTVTASWSRVEIPTQTLANPTVGFRIVASGDAIAIDYVQNEASAAQASSPIATTTASVTRPADTIVVTTPSFLTGYTGLTVMGIASGATPHASALSAMFNFDGAVPNVDLFMRQSGTVVAIFARNAAGAVQATANIGSGLPNKYRQKHLCAVAANDAAFCLHDGTLTTDTSLALPELTIMNVGGQATSSHWNGNIERLTVWASRVSNADLQVLSAAQNDLTILAEGDSITAGSYWVPQLRTIAPGPWWTHSVAVASSSLNNATPALNINSTARKAALDALRTRYVTANPDRPVITTIFTGHNDLATDGNSAATFLAELEAYCDERRAAGHVLVVVPPTPSTTAGMDAFRATVSAAIATWVGTHADYVVDWTGVSGMDDADASNTALWVDGVHPSVAQSLVMAQAMKTQVFDVAAEA